MKEHPKKPKPPSKRAYRAAVEEIMERWAPRIYPCAWCGYPVLKGYCCTTCGSSCPNVDEPPKEPK